MILYILVVILEEEDFLLNVYCTIVIKGGFSMGGALALHTAYRWDPNVAGVFAFSSFLNDNSVVYKELRDSATKGKTKYKLF